MKNAPSSHSKMRCPTRRCSWTMIQEILSPPAFIALTAVLTTAAVAWAIVKSRAEKLDATQRANDQQVEALHAEIVRLSSAPPPPMVALSPALVREPSGRVSALPPTRREGGAYSLIHRDQVQAAPPTVPDFNVYDRAAASIDEGFEYQGSLIPPPPASIRGALETLPGVGIAPKSTRVG